MALNKQQGRLGLVDATRRAALPCPARLPATTSAARRAEIYALFVVLPVSSSEHTERLVLVL